MSHRDNAPVSKKRLGNGARERERESKKKKIERFCGHTRRENKCPPASQPTEEEAAAAGCDAMH
jgi:hypothetical protein